MREFRGARFPTVVNTTWRNMFTSELQTNYDDLKKSFYFEELLFFFRWSLLYSSKAAFCAISLALAIAIWM